MNCDFLSIFLNLSLKKKRVIQDSNVTDRVSQSLGSVGGKVSNPGEHGQMNINKSNDLLSLFHTYFMRFLIER